MALMHELEPQKPTALSKTPSELLELAGRFKNRDQAVEFILSRESGNRYSPEFVMARLVAYFSQLGALKASPREVDAKVNYRRLRHKVGDYLERVGDKNPGLSGDLQFEDPKTHKTVIETLRERFVDGSQR